MSNFPPPLIFTLQAASIMGITTTSLGGNETGGGNASMEQVPALLTVTISPMIRTLADAMKKI